MILATHKFCLSGGRRPIVLMEVEPCLINFLSVPQRELVMWQRRLLKSELDICIIASCEATPVRNNCAKLMTCSGLPVSSIRTVSYKSRATKYECWLSMASMMGTMVALISSCSRHASGSWDTLVHGSGISAISVNQVCRFRSDHDCLNTATGQSSSAALPTAAFIIFAEQSGDFFVGMVQSDGSSPAFMPAILMPTLLLEAAGDGLVSPFTTS